MLSGYFSGVIIERASRARSLIGMAWFQGALMDTYSVSGANCAFGVRSSIQLK